MLVHLSAHNADETTTVGERIGRLLQAGDVVCLYGELGSGKTVLAKGLARGLGVVREGDVRSPSFVLIHRYEGRVPVYHADLFRLAGPADVGDIGLRELLGGEGVTIIEWADKLEASLAMERLDITLQHAGANTRLMTLQGHGARYLHLLEEWQDDLARRADTCHPGRNAAGMAPA
jgi:tRNA threonylcarbamoyladenosine biosynthesis protein TsaE